QELGLIDRQRGVKVAGGVAEEYMESRLEYRAVFSEEQVVELPDGRLISTKDRPLARGGFISIQTDITELVEARNSFHKSEQQLLDAIEGLDEGFVSFDNNDRLVIANSTYRKMYPSHKEITPGLSFEDLIKVSIYAGETPVAIGCEEEWIARRLQQHHTQSPVDEQLLSNGLWVKVSERRTENDGVVCISTDISEAKKNQDILELYATTDEMTGLLNRRTGLLMLDKLMAQFQRSDDDLTICYIDIDGLKSVNDKFGHENGDLLIKTISSAAKETTREGDIIMRLGGDEFLIAFPYCSTTLANEKMEAIKQRLNEIRESEKYLFELSFSYGTSAYLPEPHGDVEEYVAHADKLMYKNKLERRTVRQEADTR
ncbi:MAG: diguanylate cyclase, partial [Gammaproteobacteria bacterium]|nr:diguanylate cyclase [Gammaproteobacteria bacterium]